MIDLTDKLFHQVTAMAKRRGYLRFHVQQDVPGWEDAAHDAAIDCLMKRDTFKGDSAFSTWAQTCVDNTLTDWARVQDVMDSIDDEEHPVEVEDSRASLDEKIFLKEIKGLLDPEERELFELRATGLSFTQLGEHYNKSTQWASNRFKLLEKRIQELGGRK